MSALPRLLLSLTLVLAGLVKDQLEIWRRAGREGGIALE